MSKLELAEAKSPADPFDLASLRLSHDFVETAGVQKLITTVPVRKPVKQDFVRVHSSPEYRADLAMIELKEEREQYLVRPEMFGELTGETTAVTVYTAVNRQGVVFLWPVALPSPDGRPNEWHRSAREAAEMARGKWLRVRANMSLGAYEMTVATGAMADPTWPDLSFQELLRVAFRDRMIASLDHPIVKRLRGLA